MMLAILYTAGILARIFMIVWLVSIFLTYANGDSSPTVLVIGTIVPFLLIASIELFKIGLQQI